MNKQIWQVWSLDVWGNGDEGYEVNDRRRVGKIELPIDFTNHDIATALSHVGLVSPRVTGNDIDTDGDDTIIFVNHAILNYPIFQLEVIEENEI